MNGLGRTHLFLSGEEWKLCGVGPNGQKLISRSLRRVCVVSLCILPATRNYYINHSFGSCLHHLWDM